MRNLTDRLTPDDIINGVRTVGDFSLSPDGKSVAYSRETSGDSQIFIAGIRDLKPEQLTDNPGPKTSLAWSPKSDLIAFVHEEPDSRCSLRTISLSDRSIRTVIELETGSIWDLTWSPDGKKLLFCSNCKGSMDIFTVNAGGNNLLRITSGSDADRNPRWSPDGSRVLYYRCIGQGPLGKFEMRIVTTDGKNSKVIGPKANRNSWGRWSPDGRSIAFTSNLRGNYHICILDLDSGDVKWITAGNRDYWNPIWSPDGSRLAYQSDITANRRIAIADLTTLDTKLIGPDTGICSDMEFTRDSRSLVFMHEGPLNPLDLWYVDLATDNCYQLTSGLPDGIEGNTLTEPEEISYYSADSLKIPALLFRPKAEKPDKLPPAIIRLHGGPNYQTFNVWIPRIQLLVSAGYLVLAPQFRGSCGYGKDFEERSINDWGGGDLKDVIAAAEWLKASRLADPDRIALLGGSYGGYLMLMAMAKAPALWVAGIDLYGFVDLKTFHESTSGWLREWLENQIGSPEENLEFYRTRSPITHCPKITAPLLMLQGAKDERVPLSQAEQLKHEMENNGSECSLVIFKDEDHYFSKKPTQIKVIEEILCFLNNHTLKK